MKKISILIAFLCAFLLLGCAQKDGSEAAPDSNAQHATVSLRDGTTVTGAVTASTPSQITLNMDSGGTRTILMKDVRSVDYGEPVNPRAGNTGSTAPPAAYNRPPAASSAVVRTHPDRTAIQTTTFQIPAGTEVSVRNDEAIDSSKAVEGQTYAAEVTDDVRDANGSVVIPHGANAQLIIKSVSTGGHIRGASDLVVDLRSISVDGQQYAVTATDFEKDGREGIGANKRTAEFTGGGAALGAIIGAIAGQGKGALIGGASGAGAGALTQILTKGSSVKIPPETLMTFKLERPIRIVERR
jgi:hypothetical protein